MLAARQAGWHVSARPDVPPDVTIVITIVPLPAAWSEPNPQDTVWRFPRDTWPSNQVSSSWDATADHGCRAWHRLADQPWNTMPLGTRDRGHRDWGHRD